MARLWRKWRELFLPLLFVAMGGCDKTAVRPGVAGSIDGGAVGNADVRMSDQNRIDSESREGPNELGGDGTDAEPPDELRTDAPADDQDSGADGGNGLNLTMAEQDGGEGDGGLGIDLTATEEAGGHSPLDAKDVDADLQTDHGDIGTVEVGSDGGPACLPAFASVCAPYTCVPGTNQCRISCTKEEDCAAGPCVSGICGPWSASQCLRNSECVSGFCAQGVCCDSACQSPCVTCNLAQHVGICSPVPSGALDPKASCVDQKVSSCGTTGRCDGAGGCQKYSSTTICRAASCAAGVQTGFGVCDGLGSCVAGQQSVCLWGCADGAARCSRGCPSGDGICVGGSYCSGDEECRAKKQDGPCSSDHECLSGFCAQGVCCASVCVGPCFACNQSGTAGTCARVPNPDASWSCTAFL